MQVKHTRISFRLGIYSYCSSCSEKINNNKLKNVHPKVITNANNNIFYVNVFQVNHWLCIRTSLSIGQTFHRLGARCSSVVRVFAHGAMARVGSILHGVDPLSYFSFQPVLHDWCYPGYGMVHIKEPLLWQQGVSSLTI